MSEHAQSPMLEIDFGLLQTQAAVLQLQEQPFLGHVNLRGNPDNAELMSAVSSVLGELPIAANTVTTHGAYSILWLGPDEWLIITPQDGASPLVAELRIAIGENFAAVTDVTGGNTLIELSGSAASDLLAKGSPLDFHPSAFGLGQCAQTIMAKTAVTIYPTNGESGYRLVVRRSFADYLGVWLLDAAREFEA